MISLETFKKIMQDIQKQEEKDDKLTELLVNDNCYGWISTCSALIDDIIELLKSELNDGYDYLDWWMYDFMHDDEKKYVYESIDEKYCTRFDLTELDDLYYYIIGEISKVKQEKVLKEKGETFTQTCNIDDIKDMWEKQSV